MIHKVKVASQVQNISVLWSSETVYKALLLRAINGHQSWDDEHPTVCNTVFKTELLPPHRLFSAICYSFVFMLIFQNTKEFELQNEVWRAINIYIKE